MDFQLPITILPPSTQIEHEDKLMLVGSCFTEHMSARLAAAKWTTYSNPNGILFNPLSVADAINSYIECRTYEASSLFYLNDTWNHWGFHSQFSHINPDVALSEMNESIAKAHTFLKDAKWLVITFGSAFQYFDTHETNLPLAVANCHRAPGQWFEKRLLSIATITDALQSMLNKLTAFNPKIRVIFTISPVRHIRDGVVENNRSKARLLESVHTLVDSNPNAFYFPAYELAIDVLRDYRFYDIDMVHPNYACTQYIWERFLSSFMSASAQQTAKIMKEITTAYQHKTRFPETDSHTAFLKSYSAKIENLQLQFPYIDFQKELAYFKTSSL